jgi:hypothetical protein
MGDLIGLRKSSILGGQSNLNLLGGGTGGNRRASIK